MLTSVAMFVFNILFLIGLIKFKQRPLPKTNEDRLALVNNWRWAIAVTVTQNVGQAVAYQVGKSALGG